jgi:hypothetical protein
LFSRSWYFGHDQKFLTCGSCKTYNAKAQSPDATPQDHWLPGFNVEEWDAEGLSYETLAICRTLAQKRQTGDVRHGYITIQAIQTDSARHSHDTDAI